MAVVLWVHFATVVAAFALTEVDQRQHRLPDGLTLGLWSVTALATLWLAVAHGLSSIAQSAVVGSALTVLALWLLAELPGRPMGFGDVKLGGALGMQVAWYGEDLWWSSLVIAFFSGGVFSLVQWLRGRLGPRDPIAFGPFLLLGWFSVIALTAHSRSLLAETI